VVQLSVAILPEKAMSDFDKVVTQFAIEVLRFVDQKTDPGHCISIPAEWGAMPGQDSLSLVSLN
jgi:hypothetical protein